ncbi:MAG: uracil-DNA glycosylase [Parachlamydiaceae bacterium]
METWKDALSDEKHKLYFKELEKFVAEERKNFKIYPPEEMVFNALKFTPLDKVKVVLIGQDPYHGDNQAHGLSFSVQDGVPLPPSLKNIFKELESDLGIKPAKNGNLTKWAKEGVLLLNATLTVRSSNPLSHHGKGWETFTDKIVDVLARSPKPLVFILWGNSARKKFKGRKTENHLIIESAHPSPLSAHNGFFGSKPFSKTNNFLVEKGLDPIDWQL